MASKQARSQQIQPRKQMKESIEHIITLINQERAAQDGGQLVVAHCLRVAIKDISKTLSPLIKETHEQI